MASRRQSLKALAEERGMSLEHFGTRIETCWDVSGCIAMVVDMPTRRAAEAGLRAALESMPLKRKGRG